MGGTNTSGGKNIKFYTLKSKAEANIDPHFALSEKVEGTWKVTAQFNAMVGFLKSADIKEKEYQGKKFNVFIIVMEDDNETSQIEMSHNNISYSFINSLAKDCNKLDTYKFEVWKKPAPQGNKFFANGAVKRVINSKDEKLEWSIDPKAAPQREPIIHNGKQLVANGSPVFDYEKQQTFWEGLWRDKVMATLNTGEVKNNTPVSTGATSTTPAASGMNDIPDDLPF